MTGAIRSIRENSFQLYHAMSAAEPAICKHCTTSTNATSCTPARTLSMSDVNRLMMRPNLVWLKNDIGMVISLREQIRPHVVHHRLAQFEREPLAEMKCHHGEQRQKANRPPHTGRCPTNPGRQSGR